jgi:hypothetical protein
MKHPLALTALLLVPLAALHATDAPISHRVLLTDYQGNRVVILSAKGEIEWEFPAKTPQDCWLLPNENVLFSQITGTAEVTMDKKVVWEYKAPTKALVHSCQPLPDGNVLVAECVTGRLVVVGRDGKVVKEIPPRADRHHPRRIPPLQTGPHHSDPGLLDLVLCQKLGHESAARRAPV